MSRVTSFWAGYFAGMAVLTLAHLIHQDYLGKDRFLALVQAKWINLPWWPWAAMVLLCAVWANGVLKKLRKQDNAG